MPELPEVETIKLQLRRFLIGHKITNVEIRYAKKFEGDSKYLIGGKIKNVRRFGKVTVIDLDNDYSLAIHIKLTGQLIYRGPKLRNKNDLSKKVIGGLGGKHTHIIFKLDKGGVLYYNDFRKFGWLKVLKTGEVEKIDLIKNLGPEPLDGLDLKLFSKIVSKTKRAIKVVLMDQRKVSGIGNIYANDALYLAKVNPKRKSNSLSKLEIKRLYDAIEEVLKRGLKYGGASELSFVTPDGNDGKYQEHTLIYGKKGDKCKVCGSIFKKTTVGGRGTYYCPVCQAKT